MAKFIVFHNLLPPTPLSEGEPVAKAAKKYSTPEANWVSTWNALDEQGNVTKICSEWDAKDKESIRGVLEKIQLEIPGVEKSFVFDGIYPLMKMDSEAYR
ncbi:MAG: hypothetical protein WCO26_25575 [Deltaproteobacteria bacterium]